MTSPPGVVLSLQGKVALVTGGSRGIGAATVKMFVQAGAKVVFNYQKARAQAEKLVAECGGDTKCLSFHAELSSPEETKPLVDAAVRHFGRIDCLVANHGIWPPQDVSVDAMDVEQWRKTIGINLDSVFGLIKYAVGHMKRQGHAADAAAGRIVIISSTAGQRGEAFHCDYAASKGAVISMVKGLSTELARDRIYVNCVAPGWVLTDMSQPAFDDPGIRERVLATIPLGRAGTPQEIAAPVLFLCTEHAGFITGEILNVNGGAVLVG